MLISGRPRNTLKSICSAQIPSLIGTKAKPLCLNSYLPGSVGFWT